MIAILAELQQCVLARQLPMYFDTNVNLLDTANQQEMNLLAAKICEFRANEQQALLAAIHKQPN